MTGNNKGVRLAQAAKEFNVGTETITAHLKKKGFDVDNKATFKLSEEMYEVLERDFAREKKEKERAEQVHLRTTSIKETEKNETDNSNKAPLHVESKTDNVVTETSPQSQPLKEELPILSKEKPKTDVNSNNPHKDGIEKVSEEHKKPQEEKPIQKAGNGAPKPKPIVVEEPVMVPPARDIDAMFDEFDAMPLDFKPIHRNKGDKQKGGKDNREQQKQKNTTEIAAKPIEEQSKSKEETPDTETQELFRADTIESYGVTGTKVVGKIDLDSLNFRTRPDRVADKKKEKDKRINKQKNDNRQGSGGESNKGANNNNQNDRRNQPQKGTPNAANNNNSQNANNSGTDSDHEKKKKRKRIKVDKKVNTDSTTTAEQNPNAQNKRPQAGGNQQNQQNQQNQGGGGQQGRGGGGRDNNQHKPGQGRGGKDNQNQNKAQNQNQAQNKGVVEKKRPTPQVTKKKADRDKQAQGQTEVSEKEIQDKIRATMAKLSGGARPKNTRAKLRKQKRDIHAERQQEANAPTNILHVTEFVTVSELAKLMDITATKVISTCFAVGIIVTINQRLDAELIELVASEFNFEVEFIGATEEEIEFEEVADDPAVLVERPPIVTIMGHVDHGKTSLLDYIRKTKVVEGEAGGITQHIGAYQITTQSGKKITFLDTPGHEAFTAMRARGTKVTDIVVIVIAADDSVMPTTKEAISHARAANVPMIFAINKIDRPESNPERIREQLAQMDLLVEEWGGKYQSQEISAKKGINIDELLEKILLEAELLELKANPDRLAGGSVIEATLDKGKGYITTLLVQNGSLQVGDIILCGQYSGKVRAMFNEVGKKVKKIGPSGPAQILGLGGAPQAGEKFRVLLDEQEARQIASKREQIIREQQQRARRHITLDEIGRRLALGTFKELNLIIKGDVDGSVQALSDSLLQLSTEEIQVRIIHRGVGAITETDVLLASASDAIIIGFQVRPTPKARKNAEDENIDVRTYSIIYQAIDEVKAAMIGMLEPKFEERFACTVEVRDVFKVTKVGTIAGCLVTEGKIKPDTKIRLLRDGIIMHTGTIASLKRYKDDVKEVFSGMECGIAIKNFQDIQVGDLIEGFDEISVKRTL